MPKSTKTSQSGKVAPKKTTTATTKATVRKQLASTNKQTMKATKKASPVKPSPKTKVMETLKPVFNKQTKTALIIVLVIGLAYIFRGQFIAAMVNGQPIWRYKVIKQAENAQGPQILDNLVLEALIVQKAKATGVVVADEAVNAQIDEIKQNVTDQGQDFDQLLAAQNLTMAELQRQIRIQQMVETMAMSDSQVTDEQIAQFLEENKDYLPEDSTEAELQDLARQQLEQQALSEQYQQWITDLKTQAKIQYMVDYALVEPTEVVPTE